MEIKLNIDETQVSASLTEILENLSEDQKKSFAQQVLGQWFNEPTKVDQELRSTTLISELRAMNEISVKDQDNSWRTKLVPTEGMSDKDIINSETYKERLPDYKTPKQRAMLLIHDEVVEYHKKQIAEAISKDPQLEQVKDEAFKTVKALYPQLVTQAMSNFFNQHFNQLQHEITDLMSKMNMNSDQIQGIEQRLLNMGQ